MMVNLKNINLVGDNKILPFKIIDLTTKTNEYCKKFNYLKGIKNLSGVKNAYILIPELSEHFKYQSLNLEIENMYCHKIFDDWDSDENYDGSIWKINDSAVGVAVSTDNILDDYTSGNEDSFPCYLKITSEIKSSNIKFLVAEMSWEDYKSEDSFDRLCSFDIAFNFL